MKARIIFLHKTEAEWNKLNFRPALGELVIYDPDDKVKCPRIKIGDGSNRLVQDLPFLVNPFVSLTDQEFNTVDGGRLEDLYKA